MIKKLVNAYHIIGDGLTFAFEKTIGMETSLSKFPFQGCTHRMFENMCKTAKRFGCTNGFLSSRTPGLALIDEDRCENKTF